ncbi:MAG: uroporphyrinogen decarboxylase family protein [Candidatus Latescibacterota bacterium]
MTRRERLRRCYCHEETDRPAVYSRTGFPTNDPTYDRLKAYLHLHTEQKHTWRCGPAAGPGPLEYHEEPHSSTFKRGITVLHTPAGDLQRTELVSLRGQPGMQETYLVKSPEDAARYLSLPLPECRGHGEDSFRAAAKLVGDRGIVDVSLGMNPAGFVAELCGSETFALLSVTDRDVLHALCRRQAEVLSRCIRHVLGLGIGPFFSMLGQEYLVPPLHGPRDFQDFSVRYDRPLVDLVHGAGGRMHVHCHGPIAAVFDGFLEMGVDVLHPCEPPPMGNITAAQVRQRAQGRLCMEGNIQINRMYQATPDQIRAETLQLIADGFDRGGLIVSPSASPYIRGQGETCFPQYKAMIDAVVHWRSGSPAHAARPQATAEAARPPQRRPSPAPPATPAAAAPQTTGGPA